MAGIAPLVNVRGEVRDIRTRPIADKTTGEMHDAYSVVVLTSAGDEDGGFCEIYVAPEHADRLPPAPYKGHEVDITCRAYAVTRNYGTEERPKFGKALGLSYVSGAFTGSPASTYPVAVGS